MKCDRKRSVKSSVSRLHTNTGMLTGRTRRRRISSALPPDVRRWLCPADVGQNYFGLCPPCGLAPLIISRMPRQGRSPTVRATSTAWLSHASHPAAKPISALHDFEAKHYMILRQSLFLITIRNTEKTGKLVNEPPSPHRCDKCQGSDS